MCVYVIYVLICFQAEKSSAKVNIVISHIFDWLMMEEEKGDLFADRRRRGNERISNMEPDNRYSQYQSRPEQRDRYGSIERSTTTNSEYQHDGYRNRGFSRHVCYEDDDFLINSFNVRREDPSSPAVTINELHDQEQGSFEGEEDEDVSSDEEDDDDDEDDE